MSNTYNFTEEELQLLDLFQSGLENMMVRVIRFLNGVEFIDEW